MTTTKIEFGTRISGIKNKTLVVKNGHGGRKIYAVPGEHNDVLVICLNGSVLEVIGDLARQGQRIHQGW